MLPLEWASSINTVQMIGAVFVLVKSGIYWIQVCCVAAVEISLCEISVITQKELTFSYQKDVKDNQKKPIFRYP